MLNTPLNPVFCDWCGHRYVGALNTETELQHLFVCAVYQTKPVAEIRDGKEFIEYPNYPGLLVERVRAATQPTAAEGGKK